MTHTTQTYKTLVCRLLFAALISASLSSNHASAANHKAGTVKQCQQINKKIEKLSGKRRAGGSAKQMNKWKKMRDKLSDKAYHLNCRRHGIHI